MTQEVTRRDFVSALAILLGSAGLSGCSSAPTPLPKMSVAEYLDSCTELLPAAAEIGRVYIYAHQEEAKLKTLREFVQPEQEWETLQATIRREYREGKTVSVYGWPLSVTEARLYAMIAQQNRR